MALLSGPHSRVHCHTQAQLDHAATCLPVLHRAPSYHRAQSDTSRLPPSLKAINNNSSSSNSSASGQSNRPLVQNSSITPARLLHTLEFSAIAIAALGQAAILVSTAVCQWRQTQQIAELQDQLSSRDGSLHEAAASTSTHHVHQQHQQQDTATQQVQHGSWSSPAAVPAAHSGLHLVTGSALVVGLLCGAGLRQLQLRHPMLQAPSNLKPSADAAVRLAALEVALQQTATQLTTTSRQMDKLQARVRLATSDLKQPIRAAQGAAAQQAAALLKLSEQQLLLQKQVDGSQELIAALQGLAAKQFKVSAEALQQLKQGQAQLSGSTSKALKELQRQQQLLQQQIQSQQQQLRALEQQAAVLRSRQQLGSAAAGAGNTGSSGGSVSSSSHLSTPPDPWQHKATAESSTPSSSSNSGGGADKNKHSVPPSNGHMRSNGAPNAGLNGTAPPAATTSPS